ncbi:hypothetical protein V1460_27590 [Streptomyces sp. SCSIO 30461]|uniref:hypothetical protein n=1 Tax=Streptomyces sp. SCSIO 30461 TaxID=3118085 RepID=UPI0030D17885
MTVHGELEVVPAATTTDAADALADFTEAYNAADRAYDPALDAAQVTGALGAINQAGLKARSVTSPRGNPQHRPLELSDAKFYVPQKAGWPRWFLADTDSNRDVDSGDRDSRWLVVFVKTGNDAQWKATYLAILGRSEVPRFRTDQDGYAVPVSADSDETAVAPNRLSKDYASYLGEGKPDVFAAGEATSEWRERREQKSRRTSGLVTEFVDQPLNSGQFAPLGLVTNDGGALVFFSMRYYERQTAPQGYRPKPSADERALMTGEIKNTLTKEWMSSQAAKVAPRGGKGPSVAILGRLQGVTSAKGS